MPQEYDEFEGGSGLVDDFDGLVTDDYFSTDSGYNNGQTLCLHLELATDDTSNPEVRNIYPTGPDWASYDDGATAEHPKGERQRFNGNSKISKLYAAVIACGPEAEAEIRRRSREQYNGQGHRHAGLLRGMKFHWNVKTEHVEFTDKLGKEVKRDTFIVLPTSYLGVEPPAPTTSGSTPTAPVPSTTTAAATASAPAPAASTTTPPTGATPASTPPSIPPTSQPTPSSPLDTMTPEDAARLRLLAKTQTYPDFVDSALEIPGLPSNVAVVSMLGDEAFYESLKV
jgi:hypothetical protein